MRNMKLSSIMQTKSLISDQPIDWALYNFDLYDYRMLMIHYAYDLIEKVKGTPHWIEFLNIGDYEDAIHNITGNLKKEKMLSGCIINRRKNTLDYVSTSFRNKNRRKNKRLSDWR